jgi:colanic acid biosynthesis glycosyl transferase WcaI
VSSQKRILLLNRFFYPDQSPTSILLSELAFSLSERNFPVTAISSRLRYDDRAAQLPPSEAVGGVEIRRVWSFRSGNDDLIGRAVEYLSFYFTATFCLWRLTQAGDVIIAKTDPPLLSVPAAIIAKLRGARLINWLQDLFPEVAENLGVAGGPGRVTFRLLKPLRNWSLRSAASNVVLGYEMAKALQREGIDSGRIEIIPNWADGKLIAPITPAANELRSRWGLGDFVVVGYIGNFGRAHDFDTIIEAVTLHQQRVNVAPASDFIHRVIFLFVGGGAQRKRLEREVAARKLRNVKLHPYQPPELLAQAIGAADIHLISLKPELEGLMVPSKFYGIAAAGRPTIFIGSTEGEIAQLIEQARCGVAVRSGNGKALLSSILELAMDPSLIGAMGSRARLTFEDRWEKHHALARWQAVVDTVSSAAA